MRWLRRAVRLFAFELLRKTELPQPSSQRVADRPPPVSTGRFEDVSEAARAWLAVHEITDRRMQLLVHKFISESEVLRLREKLTQEVSDDTRCVWAGHKFADHCRLGLWMQGHQLNAVWYPASDLGLRWLKIGAAQDPRHKQEVLRS